MPEDVDAESLRERIEEIDRAAADLRELGAHNGIPAIERNAERIEAVVRILEANVPPELVEADGESNADG